MATAEKYPECGRHNNPNYISSCKRAWYADAGADPNSLLGYDAMVDCLRAQLTRVTAERDEAVAELVATRGQSIGTYCTAPKWNPLKTDHICYSPAKWSKRAQSFRCAECEAAGR